MSSAKKVEPRAYILINCQKKKLKIQEGRAFGTIFDISASRSSSDLVEDFNLYAIINEKGNGKIRQFNAMLLIIKYFSSKLLEIIYE